MQGYNVNIVECSKELTARERLMVKDLSNAKSLDTLTQDSPLVICVTDYAVLAIHNEKSEDKDYTKYLLFGKDGQKFETGSQSFWDSFKEIFDEMKDTGEEYEIEVYRLESKNYKGKSFITCSIV